jgi:hypothetical protein
MRVFRSFSFLPFVSLSAASPDAQVPGGLISTASAPNAVRCKVIPDSPQWPSEADWASLNRTIKGRLLKPDPPAAACHAGYPSYDSSACEAVIDGFKDSTWHINHPTSNMWQNFNNYSCMPGKAGTCTNSGYPIYVVKAREPADVKAAVDFARKKNVRLNIKSTGHDFLGR